MDKGHLLKDSFNTVSPPPPKKKLEICSCYGDGCIICLAHFAVFEEQRLEVTVL